MFIAFIAAGEGIPIYLTRTKSLRNEDILNSYNQTYIIGGENAVSSRVEEALDSVSRIAGANRYKTNINVLNEFGVSGTNLYIVTGNDFADALTGSLLAARNQSAMVLVRNDLLEYLKTFISND